jgi:hypothetical protein
MENAHTCQEKTIRTFIQTVMYWIIGRHLQMAIENNSYYTKHYYDLYGHTESPFGAWPPNPILQYYNAFKTKYYEQ